MKDIKRYCDALAQVLSLQPDEVMTDLPSYLRGVEEQFEQLKIPTRYRARLVYRYLSARGSRGLCANENCDFERVWPYCEMLFGPV